MSLEKTILLPSFSISGVIATFCHGKHQVPFPTHTLTCWRSRQSWTPVLHDTALFLSSLLLGWSLASSSCDGNGVTVDSQLCVITFCRGHCPGHTQAIESGRSPLLGHKEPPCHHRPHPREPGSLPTLNAVVEVNERGLTLSKYKYVELSGERPGPQRKDATERGWAKPGSLSSECAAETHICPALQV